MAENVNQRPETVKEVEADLKEFLTIIKPIIDVVNNNKNRSALFVAGSALKKIMSSDDLIKDLAGLGPLLDKYQYLYEGN